MTFEEFEKRFRQSSAFDRYLNILYAISFIGTSVYLLIAMFIVPLIKFPDGKIGPCIVVLLLLSLSISILAVHKSRYRLTIWNNNSSKQVNVEKIKMMLDYLSVPENKLHEDYAYVWYKPGWGTKGGLAIHLFADIHFIAINVRNMRGLGYDFGKAKELYDSLEIYSFDVKSEV